MIQNLGNHILVELYDCNTEHINDRKYVEKTLIEAVKQSKATMVESVIHEFSPHGISGVIVIEESHFSIHTWPEYGYCALDIFTCGTEIEYIKGLDTIRTKLEAKNISVNEIKRGILDFPVKLHHKPQNGKKNEIE